MEPSMLQAIQLLFYENAFLFQMRHLDDYGVSKVAAYLKGLFLKGSVHIKVFCDKLII